MNKKCNKIGIILLSIIVGMTSCNFQNDSEVEREKNVDFSEEYILKNKDQFIVEIPEVHELANILVALSKVGRIDSNMIDMETNYYKEVMNHFDSFSSHPILDTINSYIVKPLDNQSYYYYYTLKMDACAYKFNNHKIENEGYIKKLSWDFYENPFEKHKALIEDFAKISDFKSFYQKHDNYYNELISVYKELNPIAEMQTWLQDKFGKSYSSYKAVFSPLVGGAHAANKYSDNGFEQTFMFVARSEYIERLSKERNIISSSRVLFTEIDHHFVNPVSETKRNIISDVYSERTKWIDDNIPGATAYPDDFAIFNEYMTWGLFSLYIIDKYSLEEVNSYIPLMEKQMEIDRGFVKFGRFNQELLRIWLENPKISMNDLFNHMFEWSSKE